jgi:hypothetical protein
MYIFNEYSEAAMGIEVKAQTRESDYIKAGHR